VAGTEPAPTATPSPPVAATTSPAYVPQFVEANCAFDVPAGYQPRCGYLIVPEDRADPAGRKVRLHVAIFKSTAANPAPDPAIYLVGGPGGSALAAATPVLARGGSKILEKRDFILFDQRGAGYSQPYLFCLRYDEYLWDAHERDMSLDDYNAGALPEIAACLDDWSRQGVKIAAYDDAENAADVNDLRLALGYQQVDLFGVSYGTRLALEVMRDHPAGVRSVILDSVFPPQANLDLELAANANRSLQAVFQACAADAHCTAAYGDIEARFYEVVDRLEAAPVRIDVSGPYRDQPYRVYLDGDLFIDTIFVALYSVAYIAEVPRWIDAAYKESYDVLSDPVGGSIGYPGSTGLFWSTTCADEIPFETGTPEPSALAGVPTVLREHFTARYAEDVCRLWNVPASGSAENEAVVSDIPTLVLSGSFDPVTPPRYGELAAQGLKTPYRYEFPGVSHGVMRSNSCALQMGLAFLDDPFHAPDSSCIGSGAAVEFH
jgi:pimeloyl-ACP methyl ester carboxylesterase